MGKILSAIYLWSMHELRATAARMLDMTKNAIGNVYALLRHYCGEDLRDRPIIPIDGRTFVVKCDESKFNHKPKVTPTSTWDNVTRSPLLTLKHYSLSLLFSP